MAKTFMDSFVFGLLNHSESHRSVVKLKKKK